MINQYLFLSSINIFSKIKSQNNIYKHKNKSIKAIINRVINIIKNLINIFLFKHSFNYY